MVSSKKRKKIKKRANSPAKPITKKKKASRSKKKSAKKVESARKPPVKRTGRKRITIAQLEAQFAQTLLETRAQFLEMRKEDQRKYDVLAKEFVELHRPSREGVEKKRLLAKLAINFELETKNLMPRKGQTKQDALKEWSIRNNWTSKELWAEYRRSTAN